MSDENTNTPESFDAKMRELLGKKETTEPVVEVKAEVAEPVKETEPVVAEPETKDTKPDATAPATEDPAKVAAPDEFDPAKLPEPARKRWEEMQTAAAETAQLKQAYARLHGRVAPLQQRLAQLEKAQQPKKDAPHSDGFKSPKWLAFKKEFPEEATGIEEEFIARDQSVQALQSKIRDIEQQSTPLSARLDEFEKREQLRELASAHPDWNKHVAVAVAEDKSIVISHMSPEFRQWYGGQSLRNRDAINRVLCSDSVQDCIELMDDFESWRGQVAAKPSELSTKREETLHRAVAPSTRTTPSVARIDPSTLSAADRFDLEMKEARARLNP